MTDNSRRTARVNMRLTPESLELLREAARLQDQDLTSFILGAALDRSRRVVLQHREMSNGRA